MAGICRNRIATDSEINYHVFLNSTEDISSIIRTAGLTPGNTRVICSQNEDAMRKNLAKLPDGFTISNTLDEVKPINFYTSTCFEGQDIIDPNGRSFIVSHAGKDHTKLDISTTFIQICGRIRNSDYNEEIVHFYSTNRYLNDVTLEEFEQATREAVEEAERDAELLNRVSERRRSNIIKQLPYMEEPYIMVKDNEIHIDRNMANFDIVNYQIVNGIYVSKCNVIKEYAKSGLDVTNDDDYTAPQKIKLLSQVKIGFKDLFDLYCSIKESQPMLSVLDYRLELIEGRNQLVRKAYDILGKEEVRKMKYHQSNIRRELIARSNKGHDYKIVELINATHATQPTLSVRD
jgi:hypothetical protein